MSKLLYQGSVKNVYEYDNEHFEFEFTDAYSVFDWGRMPDLIEGKGKALTTIAESIYLKLQNPNEWQYLDKNIVFEKMVNHYSKIDQSFKETIIHILNNLKKNGLKTHFIKRSGDNRIIVKKAKVYHPVKNIQNNENVYIYPEIKSAHFIPLEVVFRLGVTKGSSFIDRANAQYLTELGFSKNTISDDEYFGFPILEMFSKLEPQDRFLHVNDAKKIASLSNEEFKNLQYTNLLVVMFLNKIIQKSNLILIDGKTEWAIDDDKNLVLVDSIGPDELRILDENKEIQLSKEFLRNYYRNSEWYKNLIVEKSKNGDWKNRLLQLNIQPLKLSNEYLNVSKNLFSFFSELFANATVYSNHNNVELNLKLQKLLSGMKKCL